MDKKTFAVVLLCVAAVFGWDYYLKSKYPDYYKQKREAQTSTETTPAPGTPPGAAPGATAATPGGASTAAPVNVLTPEDLTISSDVATYRFSQAVGGIEGVTLSHYAESKDKDAGPMQLLDSPMALQGVTDPGIAKPVAGAFNGERQGRTVRFSRQIGDVKITQEYTVPEKGYGLAIKLGFTNASAAPIDLTAGLLGHEDIQHKRSSNLLGFLPGVVTEHKSVIYRADASTTRTDTEKFCKNDDVVTLGDQAVDYVGFDKHYFLTAIMPKAKKASLRIEHFAANKEHCPIGFIAYDRQGLVQPGETVSLEYDAFFGPKDPNILSAHSPALDTAINSGTFGFIARPLLSIIEGFYKVTGNYGVAIILLTILLKTLFYPLMKASSASMHRMKKLNPQMNAIRERYADDKARQQQELMKFMGQNKINPMKGCLPILPQIPVFFAFYGVLQTSIQLRHAPFFGWIQDLSAMDPFFVTPLLMGVAMLVQQKLTPTTGMDKTQEKIMMFMPLMFTAMMLSLPAGLTLYMLTNTVTGILQQKWLLRRFEKTEA
jgi:YidC/Oxa1 family membrane protein insertase